MKSKELSLSAMFLAIGLILPFFIGQIPSIGRMLLPIHIPVLLCGFICGWRYGAIVGFILPLLRSVLFGMPTLFPNAYAMAFELLTYGLVTGLLYGIFQKKGILAIYVSLLIAMLSGRIVWGIATYLFYQLQGNNFTFELFIAGAFISAIPGIILQLILIPSITYALNRNRYA